MSALNFPDNPTPGQQYTDPNGKVWTYNGVVWNASIDGPIVGATGVSGFSGNSGATGTSGFSGQNGTIGSDGSTGATGISGFSGTSGFSGISGYSGDTGATGSGTSGFSGYSGTQSNIAVSDQGSLLTSSVSSFNFVGDLVTATTVGGAGAVTVTVENPIVYSNTIWSWGCNGYNGRLGDNSEVVRSSPVSVVGGFTDWLQVSGGGQHSLALRTNSTLWAWGLNSSGQLGTDNTTNRSSPVSVVGGFTWSQVSAGHQHSLAVRTNGSAWAWGNNSFGRLGDNTTVSKSSPVSVLGGFTDWSQLSGGRYHSLGIRTNGTAWAWGCNSYGRLGTDNTTDRSSPVSVVGGFTDWSQIAAGNQHSLGLRTNGTAWAWGYNSNGRLGDNTTVTKSSPVSVVGGFTDWCQVSVGNSGQFSLAVRTNGTLWAWGQNNIGRLGDNTTVNKSSPVTVVGGFTDWCQVSGGSAQTLGLRTNGTLWAWGNNCCGRLGDNCTTNTSSPVSVVGGFTDWCQVSAASYHSLGLRSTAT